ncbi:MAG TPA: biosynthetic peptidoglycan transglycosylase [Gemmatimonadales bacterium]|nr:biosynthetic peptidoglycan transglycosylase [Gemmatimonadales bacterium]
MSMRRGEERHSLKSARAPAALPPRLYQPVPLEAIAPVVKAAALVAEDHRFYDHSGIDYVEFRHALGYRPDEFSPGSARDRAELWRALRRSVAGKGRMRGASTITQQLAKNLYLSSSRNPLRKVKEAVTAWRLEYWLGKDRIMELYLNVVELGPEVWGVEAASRKYFGHSARQLSLDEAAALAGSLPFPLKSNPGYRPGRMRWRQAMIIRRVRGESVEIPRTAEEVDSVRPDTTGSREP